MKSDPFRFSFVLQQHCGLQNRFQNFTIFKVSNVFVDTENSKRRAMKKHLLNWK